MNYFNECLEFSIGEREKFDFRILKRHIPKCVSIEKTDVETDKTGIDYIARISDGSIVKIDAKARKPGASKFWNGNPKEPELALERYSIVETKTVGWLFKNSADHPDYILYTFNKSDCDRFFFIPFVLLKKAAYVNGKAWANTYRIYRQKNNGYHSDALYVPACVVINAVRDCMIGVA